MTSMLDAEYVPPGGWTTDDLDELPDDGRRRELLDGVLLVSPSPADLHQVIAWRLAAALDEHCPREHHVTQGVEIRISNRRSLIPDVLVVVAETAARNPKKYRPQEVVLAIEIVSPTSESMDRVLKPALYAQAGIPFYWRIELEPQLRLFSHRQDPVAEVYRETGSFDGVAEIAEPWAMSIVLSSLLPRFLRD